MQEPLDYRGLRRWSMLILFPVLIASAWTAAILLMIVTLPLTLGALSAASIAGVGILGTAALIVPPALGILAGLIGILRAKSRVVRAFSATRLPNEHPLVRVTEYMAAKLGMPTPEVYVYPDDDINAWATGTSASNAAVGISYGALNRLSRDNVHAVVGHELGHIAAADLRRMQFAVSFQNALVWFFGFKSWRWNAQHIFGFVGQMGIMGLSRRREYWADAIGAILTSPEIMRDALRAVERDGKRPAKQRRYFNQLMFNWPGGSLLASHPTFGQRYAALDGGAFVTSSLHKMGYVPFRRQGRSASSDWRESWSQMWHINREGVTSAAVITLLLFGTGLWAGRTPLTVERLAPVVAVPAAPAPRAEKVLAPVAGPKVAAWSRAEEPMVVTPPAYDDLAYEPPGYRCFKLLDRQLPPTLKQAYDEEKEWSEYFPTAPSHESLLRNVPEALRRCMKQSGGKLQPGAASVEKRKIEEWAFANETTCWFTPGAARSGSGRLTILGRCHSPED